MLRKRKLFLKLAFALSQSKNSQRFMRGANENFSQVEIILKSKDITY